MMKNPLTNNKNLEIEFKKTGNQITVKWWFKHLKNGESMSIMFQNEPNFIEFADIFTEAKKRFIKLRKQDKI